jgi:hypothetical protein
MTEKEDIESVILMKLSFPHTSIFVMHQLVFLTALSRLMSPSEVWA